MGNIEVHQHVFAKTFTTIIITFSCKGWLFALSVFTGNTALHDCAESGSLEIMRMLLKFGASMEQDGYGMTPLLSASVTGHTNIVDYLTTHQQVRFCHLSLSVKKSVSTLNIFKFTDKPQGADRCPGAVGSHICWQKERFTRSSEILEESNGPQIHRQ